MTVDWYNNCKIRRLLIYSLIASVVENNRELRKKLKKMDSCSFKDLELHKCKKCVFKTHLKVNLKSHMDLVHLNLQIDHNLSELHQTRTCRKCKLKTHSIFVLAGHVCKKTKSTKKKNSNLKTCEESFMKHVPIRSPQRKKKEKYKCEHCPYQNSYLCKLKQHNIKWHMPRDFVKWFKCEHCPHKEVAEALLNYHVRMKHRFAGLKQGEWLQCEQCSYKTNRRDNLKRHSLRQHTDPAKIDSSQYKTKQKEIEWHECEQCAYKGKSRHNLKKHVRNCHVLRGERIEWSECDRCDYKTKYKAHLKDHALRKHTPSEEIEWRECGQCAYKTKLKSSLARHVRINHTPSEKIKWYKCGQCDYKTNIKSNLTRHAKRYH